MEATVGLGVCQVRSGTDDPCRVPATDLLFGVPFCERHAEEQKRYFEIGDLTGDREAAGYREGDPGTPPVGVVDRLRLMWRGARRG